MEDADADSVLQPGQELTEAQTAQLEEFVRDSARAGDVQDVVAALKFGVDVDAADASGNAALHMACANGHADIVAILLSRGAGMAANANRSTPLHWAAQNGREAVVKLLLDRVPDADVMAPNASGKSALDLGFACGEESVATLLLAHRSAAGLEGGAAEDGDAADTAGSSDGAEAAAAASEAGQSGAAAPETSAAGAAPPKGADGDGPTEERGDASRDDATES